MDRAVSRFQPDPAQGLSAAQVQTRRRQHLQNNAPEPVGRSTGVIFKENICTLFNLFNVLIALALALVGAWSNLVFLLIITLNTCLGIAQELRAKKLVDKLSLLSRPTAHVVRDGVACEVAVSDLVLDDVLILQSGQQICADATVLSGTIEANEALLTGESDPVAKQPGDGVLSGSFVVSGRCRARVEHVGADNYAAQLAHEAKQHKKIHSELMASMQKVTRFTGFFIGPLGLVLLLEALFLQHTALNSAVVSTAAALLGMLPKGLVLLISISLAVGVARLAKKNILVQALFSLETLAHVDVLCLDKTGTLTQGTLQVESLVPLHDAPPVDVDPLLRSFLQHTSDNNATHEALCRAFRPGGPFTPLASVPFSSARKWSAMTFDGQGTLVLGAPERLLGDALPAALVRQIENGARVLAVCWTDAPVSPNTALPPPIPLCAIVLSDVIRPGARQTLSYFKREGVEVKIISGDHPAAVCAIARQAGLAHADRFIDMTGVESDEAIARAAGAYTVFGRVSPVQKKRLVQALQAQGRSVAMTGDGVNDLLALREADCSIAIADGSDAARQVSQLVLLDSDFTALPSVLLEGRRVVNNITRVAGIFFVKTLYSLFLSVCCMLSNTPFPFAPLQITLIDLIIEAYPSFFLSFEPDGRRIEGPFLRTVLSRALPNALAVTALVIFALWGAPHCGIASVQTPLLAYLLVGAVSVMAVCKACLPFNALRVFLFVSVTAGFYAAVAVLHPLLGFPALHSTSVPLFFLLAAAGILIERLGAWACCQWLRTPERIRAKAHG